MTHTIVSLLPRFLPDDHYDGFRKLANFYFFNELTDEEKARVAQEADILFVTPQVPVNQSTLETFPNVKMVADYGVGYDQADLALLREKGIIFTNTPTATSGDVADFAMTLLLTASRGIPEAGPRLMRSKTIKCGMPFTRRIWGKKIGIAGLGHIGREIARRAEGFGMQIGYTNLSAVDCAYERFENITELARWCDYLVLAMPGGKATYHIVNDAVLEALGPDGFLINIGRGTLVDSQALVKALKAKTIACAALDVFESEPELDPAFIDCPNLIVTPHIASGTVEARRDSAAQVLENITAFIEGKNPPCRVI